MNSNAFSFIVCGIQMHPFSATPTVPLTIATSVPLRSLASATVSGLRSSTAAAPLPAFAFKPSIVISSRFEANTLASGYALHTKALRSEPAEASVMTCPPTDLVISMNCFSVSSYSMPLMSIAGISY